MQVASQQRSVILFGGLLLIAAMGALNMLVIESKFSEDSEGVTSFVQRHLWVTPL